MPYTDFDWITDRLAVGAFVSEHEADFPFDAVLSLETYAPPSVRDIVRSGRVDYRWFSIIDGYSGEEHDQIVKRFDEAADQIHAWQNEGKSVLVHCTAGVSRSVTALTWYLVRYHGYTWDDAYNLIREHRSIAFPNPRFELAMRVAAGERIEWDAFDRRIEEHCVRMVQYNVTDRRERILDDLERQGTLRRARESHRSSNNVVL